MHYLIYKTTNTVNGKFYIGQHKTNNIDDGYLGSGTEIRRAIKKYGPENFKKEILFDVEDAELLDLLEELIVDDDFVSREDTYNVIPGGSGSYERTKAVKARNSYSNMKHPVSAETRKKMSESHKGKTFNLSEETKQKMSISAKKHTSNRLGKSLSEESKQRIRNSLLKYYAERKNKGNSESMVNNNTNKTLERN